VLTRHCAAFLRLARAEGGAGRSDGLRAAHARPVRVRVGVRGSMRHGAETALEEVGNADHRQEAPADKPVGLDLKPLL
jgi:hypothetical protein